MQQYHQTCLTGGQVGGHKPYWFAIKVADYLQPILLPVLFLMRELIATEPMRFKVAQD